MVAAKTISIMQYLSCCLLLSLSLLMTFYFAPVSSSISAALVAAESVAGGIPSTVPPLVFILGVQKGGSSSLMWMCMTHPQLCSGVRKETHFFGGTYENMIEEGLSKKEIQQKYYSIFLDPKCTQNTSSTYFVDGTPVMHQAFWAAKNINDMYRRIGLADDIKFIVMLREPVSRDFSWYQHHIRQYLTGHKTGVGYVESLKGKISGLKTFKETWSSDIRAVKKGKKKREDLETDIGGDYITQLLQFMKYFRREQLFVMSSNHAFKNTHLAMEQIREFLGLQKWSRWDTDPFPHDDHTASTQNSDDPECVFRHIPQMDCDFRDMLAEHYSSTNLALDKWLHDTKGEGPPSEPVFESFGDSFQSISCVEDARADLDAIIAKNKGKDIC